MAGGKETPRQKMIGMMYLVLTALLALNISKEVLNGFVKVENSLRKTQVTLNVKNANAIAGMQNSSNPEKTAPFLAQAVKFVQLLRREQNISVCLESPYHSG